MRLLLAVVEQVVHLLTIPVEEVLEDFRKVGHLQPTQSQLEQVELALLPQQVEHLEPPHNMGWSLLVAVLAVLRLALEVGQQEQQRLQQHPQLQRFLIQELLVFQTMLLDMLEQGAQQHQAPFLLIQQFQLGAVAAPQLSLELQLVAQVELV